VAVLGDDGFYTVVDGFHRYTTMRQFKDIAATTGGLLPVVVLQGKTANELMASTIRHNRARGKHSVAGMGNLVFNMLKNGAGDALICAELGLEPDELLRLKHVTGFSKLFKDAQYKQSWTTPEQVKLKQEYKKNPEMAKS
jgi:ParB-like chromosome segregation protein Spo0J